MSVELIELRPDLKMAFREDWSARRVLVFANNEAVPAFSDPWYQGAAERAQARYELTDNELMTLYSDYKADYDRED